MRLPPFLIRAMSFRVKSSEDHPTHLQTPWNHVRLPTFPHLAGLQSLRPRLISSRATVVLIFNGSSGENSLRKPFEKPSKNPLEKPLEKPLETLPRNPLKDKFRSSFPYVFVEGQIICPHNYIVFKVTVNLTQISVSNYRATMVHRSKRGFVRVLRQINL